MPVAASASSTAPTLSGLASGLDWTNVINEMVAVEQAPETQMRTQQATLATDKSTYQAIGSNLTALQKDITNLMDPSFFDTRTAASSNSLVASATAASGTPLGTYAFTVSKLASDASWQGAVAAANPISSTDNVDGVTVGNAGFASAVTSGTFSINGQQIAIASSDTLQSVFDKINSATNGAVTASYSAASDEITLSSSSPIVLGNSNDSSNFLQVAQLYNNGGDTITSAMALGGVNLNNTLSSSNLATPITDDGSGNGEFKINGVAINFNASTDTINTVLQKINDSSAGVTATYDAVNGQFQLTNKTTGDVGISMQDVTGNFLAATGLSAGALQRGSNLQYSINGGGTLTSQSNTINSTASGVAGLSITASAVGSSAITVGTDTTTIANAISSFVSDYNAAQGYISSQTVSTTGSDGTVTPGTLTGDMDAEGIATQLRHLTSASPSGLTGAVQTVNDIGITTNGTDNSLAINPAVLQAALSTNLGAIKQMFTDSTSGLASTLNSYLSNVNGASGVLATKEDSFSKQSTSIGTTISNLQSKISKDETRLQNEFTAMETAISSINAQKQYLTDFFNNSSATTALATGSSSASSSSSTTA